MINGIKCSREVKKNENRYFLLVNCKKYIVLDSKEGDHSVEKKDDKLTERVTES